MPQEPGQRIGTVEHAVVLPFGGRVLHAQPLLLLKQRQGVVGLKRPRGIAKVQDLRHGFRFTDFQQDDLALVERLEGLVPGTDQTEKCWPSRAPTLRPSEVRTRERGITCRMCPPSRSSLPYPMTRPAWKPPGPRVRATSAASWALCSRIRPCSSELRWRVPSISCG